MPLKTAQAKLKSRRKMYGQFCRSRTKFVPLTVAWNVQEVVAAFFFKPKEEFAKNCIFSKP